MDTLTESHLRVMRRAGLALAGIGLLDIASCFVSLARGESYSSSLNIFALVAGILVYRGNASAAKFVVSGLSFLLGGFLLLPVVMPVLMPVRLLWLQLRLSPWPLLQTLAFYVALLAVLYWTRETLGALPVHGGGKKAPPLYRSVAAAVGAGIPLLLAVVLPLFMHSAAGRRAVAEAQGKVGPGYSFHVQQLNTSGSAGSAIVVAYSDSEIREVAVEWHDE